ncbi:iron-containing redox enzyme family protein [Kribbella deserti]|uniref:Iron-containing redox enzyme family protein n=1 Tax=Kribbella deserti TaxID=1926257 RepID=A0ABV6QJ06_9ACTN
MRLPPARGPLTDWLTSHLTGGTTAAPSVTTSGEVWQDEDFQLALWCCYELHYRGFEDVPPEAEWDLAVLAFRAELEQPWLDWLRGSFAPVGITSEPASRQLRELIDNDNGPSLAKYLHRHATKQQFREFVLNRSVYQLKEADPHSFGIPRLDGVSKAALVEIQADEYGGGRPERMHAELFRSTMRWLGLNDTYGHYVPEVPAVTLAVSNVMSLFALHRQWTGALLGHLAALEMTSTAPNRRYAAGAARLGADEQAARYFNEHVEADAVHEQIAAHDLCDSFVREDPHRLGDVLFGAACSLGVDNLAADHLLRSWGQTTISAAG